jgi:glycerol-3-phosphate cytidylyltransferase
MRIMVDMTAALIHHGHVALLKKASQYGTVIVGLTSDDEVVAQKGLVSELNFTERKFILEELKCVSEVVQTPWLITEKILQKHNIDVLLHGSDNSNNIPEEKLIVLPRTQGVSSTELRERAFKNLLRKTCFKGLSEERIQSMNVRDFIMLADKNIEQS